MAGVNKSNLTETDIITKFILPSVKEAGWDVMTQIRQEVKLRDGIQKNLTKVGTTVESLLFDEFASHPFMLPPLEEQFRISDRVNGMMELCENLKSHLQSAQQTQLHLADALTESAVS